MGTRWWTDSEKEFLRQHYRRLNKSEIAAALGRSASGVELMITKLGLATHKWKPEDDAFLAANSRNGWTWCAKEMNRSVTSVRSRAAKLGLRLHTLSSATGRELCKMVGSGVSVKRAAECLSIREDVALLHLRRLETPNRDEEKRQQKLLQTFQQRYGARTIQEARKARRKAASQVSMLAELGKLERALQDQ